MIDITAKINQPLPFPLEIFGDKVKESMIKVSHQYNIPIDYMGSMALFTLAGLSGGMYVGNSNGGIKTMIYVMMIGPSGVGKTPAYRVLCSNIVKEQFKTAHEQYSELLRQWKIKEKAANKSGEEFTDPAPILAVRMMTDGTPEGMIKKMQKSPCGFGVYYDEAGKIYNLTKYRTGNNGSTDFWNEIWNGDPYYDVKANDEAERYVHNPCTSLCVGVQPEAIDQVITKDSINKGLTSRMLLCESDYIRLNEDIELFEGAHSICREWVEVVSGLHWKGLSNYHKDDKPYIVNFEGKAQKEYMKQTKRLLQASNQMIRTSEKESISRVMVSYNSKLSQYFSRFCLLLAIYDDYTGPIVREKNVEDAIKLYNYYFASAKRILTRSFDHIQNDVTPNESDLFNELPDSFTFLDCRAACEKLKLSKNYYTVAIARGLKSKVRRISRGVYEKI